MSLPQKIRIVTWNCCKGNFAKKDAILMNIIPISQ